MTTGRGGKKPERKTPERQVLQAPRFAKAKKRFPAAAQLAVDAAVREILADPLGGEPKLGGLKGVRVVKFKAVDQPLLLAFEFRTAANVIEVLDVGPHENFYRELQRYLDAR